MNEIGYLLKNLIELCLIISIFVRLFTKNGKYRIYSDIGFAKYCLLITLIVIAIEIGYKIIY